MLSKTHDNQEGNEDRIGTSTKNETTSQSSLSLSETSTVEGKQTRLALILNISNSRR